MTRLLKKMLRAGLTRTAWGSAFYFCRDRHVARPRRRPDAPWWNAVLQGEADVARAMDALARAGLPAGTNRCKNWDCLAALDVVLRHTTRRSRIVDAGGEVYSMFLPWLAMYGYRDLTAINLVFKDAGRRIGPIHYRHGDVTKTAFGDGSIDAVACLSVIEHGVDVRRFFAEMRRILKPGGILVISTDYFPTPPDTTGLHAYGVPVHIFSRDEMLHLVTVARESGFELTGPLDLTARDRPVHWEVGGLDFTFAIVSLRRVGPGPESSSPGSTPDCEMETVTG